MPHVGAIFTLQITSSRLSDDTTVWGRARDDLRSLHDAASNWCLTPTRGAIKLNDPTLPSRLDTLLGLGTFNRLLRDLDRISPAGLQVQPGTHRVERPIDLELAQQIEPTILGQPVAYENVKAALPNYDTKTADGLMLHLFTGPVRVSTCDEARTVRQRSNSRADPLRSPLALSANADYLLRVCATATVHRVPTDLVEDFILNQPAEEGFDVLGFVAPDTSGFTVWDSEAAQQWRASLDSRVRTQHALRIGVQAIRDLAKVEAQGQSVAVKPGQELILHPASGRVRLAVNGGNVIDAPEGSQHAAARGANAWTMLELVAPGISNSRTALEPAIAQANDPLQALQDAVAEDEIDQKNALAAAIGEARLHELVNNCLRAGATDDQAQAAWKSTLNLADDAWAKGLQLRAKKLLGLKVILADPPAQNPAPKNPDSTYHSVFIHDTVLLLAQPAIDCSGISSLKQNLLIATSLHRKTLPEHLLPGEHSECLLRDIEADAFYQVPVGAAESFLKARSGAFEILGLASTQAEPISREEISPSARSHLKTLDPAARGLVALRVCARLVQGLRSLEGVHKTANTGSSLPMIFDARSGKAELALASEELCTLSDNRAAMLASRRAIGLRVLDVLGLVQPGNFDHVITQLSSNPATENALSISVEGLLNRDGRKALQAALHAHPTLGVLLDGCLGAGSAQEGDETSWNRALKAADQHEAGEPSWERA